MCSRVYVPALYVVNKIDQITLEELEVMDRLPHYVPVSDAGGGGEVRLQGSKGQTAISGASESGVVHCSAQHQCPFEAVRARQVKVSARAQWLQRCWLRARADCMLTVLLLCRYVRTMNGTLTDWWRWCGSTWTLLGEKVPRKHCGVLYSYSHWLSEAGQCSQQEPEGVLVGGLVHHVGNWGVDGYWCGST